MSHFKTPDASAFWEALLPKWVAAQISGRKSFLRGSERAVLNRRTQANTLGENCHAYTIALNNLHDPPDGTGVIRGGCMLEAKSSGPNHRKCLHCCLNDETLLVTPSGSNPRSPAAGPCFAKDPSLLGVPCLTLRESTERPATVEHSSNQLVSVDPDRILGAARSILQAPLRPSQRPPLADYSSNFNNSLTRGWTARCDNSPLAL
jgi:hypothetical protein